MTTKKVICTSFEDKETSEYTIVNNIRIHKSEERSGEYTRVGKKCVLYISLFRFIYYSNYSERASILFKNYRAIINKRSFMSANRHSILHRINFYLQSFGRVPTK